MSNLIKKSIVLKTDEIKTKLASILSYAKTAEIENITFIYNDVTKKYLPQVSEIVEDFNPFTDHMFEHIKKIGGEIAATNALERALAVGRFYVKKQTFVPVEIEDSHWIIQIIS